MPKKTAHLLTEKTYQTILEAVPGFIYVLNTRKQLLFANQHFLAWLRVSSHEQVKGEFYQYLSEHTDWIEPRIYLLAQADQEILTSQKAQLRMNEPPITDRRGLSFYYTSTRLPLFDASNQLLGIVVHLLDVTSSHLLASHHPDKHPASPYPPGVHRDLGQPPTILLVEDNPVAQKATEALLQQLNCQVALAATETELGDCFRPGKYDFILMDIGLAGTSGYMLAKKIRKLEEKTGYCAPIIALTGFDADVVKTDCDYYGMVGAISKPLQLETARQLIQRYVYQMPIQIQSLKHLA